MSEKRDLILPDSCASPAFSIPVQQSEEYHVTIFSAIKDDTQKSDCRKKPVRLSVNIPVFSGKYLCSCIHSVVRAFAAYGQTEILLYNDASPEPGLDDMLHELQAENPGLIRVFRGRVNIGVAAARQWLCEHSQGDYIVCFDPDDLMIPFDVKKVVDFLDSREEYCASYTAKYLFNESGYMNQVHGGDFSVFLQFIGRNVNLNGIFMRRSDVLDAGGFLAVRGDKSRGTEDLYLFARMAQKKLFYFDREIRTLYRRHQQQITAVQAMWDDWIVEQIILTHPDLSARILAGDIPDLHGPDSRLICGLMGAVCYLHWNERSVVAPIIIAALREFPDDPGVPDFCLKRLRMDGNFTSIQNYYPAALEIFRKKSDLWAQCGIINDVISAYREHRLQIPDGLEEQLDSLIQEYLKLSPAAEEMLRCLNE